jgi:hypothetical protein
MAFFITYVISEAKDAIRVTLPDFNIQTVAQSICDVPDQIQKALAEQYWGPVPKSLNIEDLQDDANYQGGWWLWLNIDVDDLTRRGRRGRRQRRASAQVAAS